MIEENELDRLEGFVSTLLEKYKVLQDDNKKLSERLLTREETIETLQNDLASMKDERGDISHRVSSLIGKIEEWEESADVTIAPEDSEDSEDSEEKSQESGVQGNLFTVDAQGNQ